MTSILHDFFIHLLRPLVRPMDLSCDYCVGQNKNYTVFRFLGYMIQHQKRFDPNRITFPERCHSYMECDKYMGFINSKSQINVPSDWVKTFKDARKKPTSFPAVKKPLREEMLSVNTPRISFY